MSWLYILLVYSPCCCSPSETLWKEMGWLQFRAPNAGDRRDRQICTGFAIPLWKLHCVYTVSFGANALIIEMVDTAWGTGCQTSIGEGKVWRIYEVPSMTLTSTTSITRLKVTQNEALRTATGCTQTYNICMTKHSYFPYTSTYTSQNKQKTQHPSTLQGSKTHYL